MSVDAAKVKVAKNLAPRRLTLPLLRGRCLAPSAFRPARDREALVTRKLKGFVPAPRREEATRTISGGPQITEETIFFPTNEPCEPGERTKLEIKVACGVSLRNHHVRPGGRSIETGGAEISEWLLALLSSKGSKKQIIADPSSYRAMRRRLHGSTG